MSKKILHCILSPSWGGLEMYTVELITEMHRHGLKQAVLCLANSKVHLELVRLGIAVVTLPTTKPSKWQHSRIIRNLIKAEKFEVLHSHSRLDLWACALALWGRSDIHHIYNLYMNAVPKKDFVHRWLFSKVDALCSSSEEILNEARNNFPIAAEKLKLVRYGRHTEIYVHNEEKRNQIRALHQAKDSQIVFGTLCRIDSGKGVRELIDSLQFLTVEELEKTQLWIVGDPTIVGQSPEGKAIFSADSQELMQWLSEKMQTAPWKGHLHHIPFQKDYISYIDALDVFVLASHKETYSLSVIDSMMMSKPVIGTQAGGTTEQVGQHNERGYLVQPRSAQSIADGFSALLKSKEDIRTKGVAASDWSRTEHSWKKTLEQYLALYQ